jgi:hypothetical protein
LRWRSLCGLFCLLSVPFALLFATLELPIASSSIKTRKADRKKRDNKRLGDHFPSNGVLVCSSCCRFRRHRSEFPSCAGGRTIVKVKTWRRPEQPVHTTFFIKDLTAFESEAKTREKEVPLSCLVQYKTQLVASAFNPYHLGGYHCTSLSPLSQSCRPTTSTPTTT